MKIEELRIRVKELEDKQQELFWDAYGSEQYKRIRQKAKDLRYELRQRELELGTYDNDPTHVLFWYALEDRLYAKTKYEKMAQYHLSKMPGLERYDDVDGTIWICYPK